MRVRIVSIALLGAALAVTAACGGSGEVTLDAYFDELQPAIEDAQDTLLPLGLDDEASVDQETPVGLQDAVPALDEDLERLRGIEVPEEAAALHEEFVEAFSAVPGALTDLAAELEAAGSDEDVHDALNGFALTTSFRAVAVACLGLGDLAEEHGIEVALECFEFNLGGGGAM